MAGRHGSGIGYSLHQAAIDPDFRRAIRWARLHVDLDLVPIVVTERSPCPERGALYPAEGLPDHLRRSAGLIHLRDYVEAIQFVIRKQSHDFTAVGVTDVAVIPQPQADQELACLGPLALW